MKISIQNIRAGLLGGAASWLLLGAPVQAEDILAILQTAENGDPQYRAAVYRAEADTHKVAQARAEFYPQIAANADYTQTHQDILSADNSVFAIGENDFGSTQINVGLDQTLFSYSEWMNLSRAKKERMRARADLEVAKQDLLLRVSERYFAALAAVETLDFVRAEKRALSELLELVETKSNRGLVRKTDAMDARARFLEAQARELEAQVSLTDALQGLREISGFEPAELNTLGPQISIVKPETVDAEYWIAQALESNPRMASAGYAAEAARKEVRRQVGGYFPTLELNVDYDYRDTDGTLFGGGSELQTSSAMVRMSVPIFDGFGTRARVREARSIYNSRQQEGVQIQREIERRTIASLSGVMTALSRIEALDASVKTQQEVVENLRTAYRSGSVPSVAVLDAERDLFFVRSELAQARYDGILNDLRLKHSIGRLTASDIAQVAQFMNGGTVSIAAVKSGATQQN